MSSSSSSSNNGEDSASSVDGGNRDAVLAYAKFSEYVEKLRFQQEFWVAMPLKEREKPPQEPQQDPAEKGHPVSKEGPRRPIRKRRRAVDTGESSSNPPSSEVVPATPAINVLVLDSRGNNFLFRDVMTWKFSETVVDNFVSSGGTWKGVRNLDGDSILHVAAMAGNVRALQYFIPRMDKEEINLKNNKGRTPLHQSVYSPAPEFRQVVDTLVASGANVNEVDEDGHNLCFLAVLRRISIIKLRFVAKVCRQWSEVNNKAESILHTAVKADNIPAFDYFIWRGADVNAIDYEGNTPLHLVQYRSRCFASDMLKCVLNHGPDLDEVNHRGYTALHFAAGCGSPQDVETLMDYGADQTITTEDGFTAVHAAIAEGNPSTLAQLLDSGLNTVEALNGEECTILHELAHCKRNFTQLFECLYAKGMGRFLNVVDANENSPLLYAMLNGVDLEDLKCMVRKQRTKWWLVNNDNVGIMDLLDQLGEKGKAFKEFVEKEGKRRRVPPDDDDEEEDEDT